jgi:hypothetical protein
MRVESVLDRFRRFMTPGRTLIALLLLFIALPSAIVWSGVGSFGPGKGAGAGASADSSGSKDKPSSDLEVASAKAKALMSSASSGSSAGSGAGGSGGAAPEKDEKGQKEREVPVGLPSINPIQVKPPMAQALPSGPQPQAAGTVVQGGKPQEQAALTPSTLSQQSAQTTSNKAPTTVSSAPGFMAPGAAAQTGSAELSAKQRNVQVPSLEEKVRAALSSRLQGGGEITITYGGDVLERSGAAPAKASPTK